MRGMRRRSALAAVTAMALVMAACGGDDASTSDAEDAPTTTAGATVTTAPAGTTDTTAASEDEPAASGTVTVYTGRHYGIEPVFDSFTAATGIEVRFTTGSDPQLRERLKAEGANTPADVLMTADAGSLALAAADGLLASIDSEALEAAIPDNLQDPGNTWFALSRRLRVIMVSERIPEADQPTTYAAVGDAALRGRLCLRPATHPYTQSLVSSIIAAEGAEGAKAIVDSWVANEPTYIDSDTKMLESIEAGECDVALTNSYYLGRILKEKGTFPVRLVWPEQDGRGAHQNISGAGVTANAVNPAAAQVLIEWLATEGQAEFASVNAEYPAAQGVAPEEVLVGFGEFKADPIAVARFGELQPEAVKLLDAAGYK
jgi:iron(III) transport system substrate-binding protein